MQMQRIQNLCLFLALGCAVAFLLLPFGVITQIPTPDVTSYIDLHVYDFLGLLIPVGLAILLLLVAFFSFRDLGFQRSVTLLALMMELVSVGIAVYILCDKSSLGVLSWRWETCFLGGAVVLTLLAFAGIARDARILRNYDRIR